MDQFILTAIIAGCCGMIIGILFGWYGAHEQIRKRNRDIADQMIASVGATRSRRPIEDMMDYDNRQRTSAPNNGQKARQGNVVFRPRRMERRR